MHLRVPSFSWHRKSKTILWKQRLLKAKEKEFHTIVLQEHLQPVWPGTAATGPTSLGGLGNTRQMTCNPSKPKFKHHRTYIAWRTGKHSANDLQPQQAQVQASSESHQADERAYSVDLPSPWTTPRGGELQQTLFNVQFSVPLRPQKPKVY